ncbi:MAG: hypothetical protein AB2551_15735 [Candidatus Thiodiazotropha sp.]
MQRLSLVLFSLLTPLAVGCSTEQAKTATFEALEQHRYQQCLEQLDSQNCDRQRQSYQEYKSERERHIQAR